jgi:hypothetical protein
MSKNVLINKLAISHSVKNLSSKLSHLKQQTSPMASEGQESGNRLARWLWMATSGDVSFKLLPGV